MSQNEKNNEPMNESILNPQISQDLKKEHTDHMAYLPNMEVLDSQIGRQILSLMSAYDLPAYTAAGIRAALAHETRTLEDFAALPSLSAQPLLKDIAKIAQVETRRHFGSSIYMFTPVYIANYCENYCIYYGFNCKNKIRRTQFEPEQVGEEMKSIIRIGLREVLVLTGKNRTKSTVPYIGETCKIAHGYFKVISLKIYPLNSDEYAYLHSCGVDHTTVLQETYNSDKRETLYPSGHKRYFPYRLNAQECALKGGMRGIGLGVLLGLPDFRKDASITGCHAWLLQRKYPHGEIAFSCPRLRPITNNDKTNPMDAHETQLLQVATAYRLLMPWVSITMSAGKYARVRDHLAPIMTTRVSAGIGTGIGECPEEIEEKGDSQFGISDSRGVDQMFRDLLSKNPQPMMSGYIYV